MNPLCIDLSGKVCVVTGATSQLGRTMVRTLAQCGADIAIHYRQNQTLADTLRDEVTAMGNKAITVAADITEKDSVFAMRDAVVAGLGVADILVNNAVSQYQWTTILEQAPEDYEGQFRSSVLHNVLMAQAFVPGMIEKGKGGRVIGINTECAMQNFATQSAYVSGKRGMDGVLRILAKEIGAHGITVNQVAPGWTISDQDRELGREIQPGYSAPVPLKRRGTDQEIANVVAFLASDLASFVSGVYLPVCGGNVMPAI
jgi:3-oxoacyl-[acyl-carrier protein] reductase